MGCCIVCENVIAALLKYRGRTVLSAFIFSVTIPSHVIIYPVMVVVFFTASVQSYSNSRIKDHYRKLRFSTCHHQCPLSPVTILVMMALVQFSGRWPHRILAIHPAHFVVTHPVADIFSFRLLWQMPAPVITKVAMIDSQVLNAVCQYANFITMDNGIFDSNILDPF